AYGRNHHPPRHHPYGVSRLSWWSLGTSRGSPPPSGQPVPGLLRVGKSHLGHLVKSPLHRPLLERRPLPVARRTVLNLAHAQVLAFDASPKDLEHSQTRRRKGVPERL